MSIWFIGVGCGILICLCVPSEGMSKLHDGFIEVVENIQKKLSSMKSKQK